MIETNTQEALAKGQVERIGMSSAVLTHEPKGKEKIRIVGEILDHSIAMEYVIAVLLSPNHGVITAGINHKGLYMVTHRIAGEGTGSAFIGPRPEGMAAGAAAVRSVTKIVSSTTSSIVAPAAARTRTMRS